MEGESELEIRQVFENEDFGENFTPELRQQEDDLRAWIEQQQALWAARHLALPLRTPGPSPAAP